MSQPVSTPVNQRSAYHISQPVSSKSTLSISHDCPAPSWVLLMLLPCTTCANSSDVGLEYFSSCWPGVLSFAHVADFGWLLKTGGGGCIIVIIVVPTNAQNRPKLEKINPLEPQVTLCFYTRNPIPSTKAINSLTFVKTYVILLSY